MNIYLPLLALVDQKLTTLIATSWSISAFRDFLHDVFLVRRCPTCAEMDQAKTVVPGV